MPQEKMSAHEAQKHARQWVRSLRAAETLEEVCDAVVDAEDRVAAANLHTENTLNGIKILEDRGVQLEAKNAQSLLDQEDIHRKGKTLAETLASYEKTVNKRVDELNAWRKETAKDVDKEISDLVAKKQGLEAEVATLRAEKERIESVVEAFQKASNQGDQE